MIVQERLDFHAPATRGRSRHDGPATSTTAGHEMKDHRLREQQALVLRAVVELGERGGNAHEVQDWLRDHGLYAPERNGIGSRFRELRDLGWVRMLDEQHEKVGQVHAATEAGRERLARYLETEAAA